MNIIDYENLTLNHPEIVYDLPGSNKRLIQRTNGYRETIISGKVAFKNGESTGIMNGNLVRN